MWRTREDAAFTCQICPRCSSAAGLEEDDAHWIWHAGAETASPHRPDLHGAGRRPLSRWLGPEPQQFSVQLLFVLFSILESQQGSKEQTYGLFTAGRAALLLDLFTLTRIFTMSELHFDTLHKPFQWDAGTAQDWGTGPGTFYFQKVWFIKLSMFSQTVIQPASICSQTDELSLGMMWIKSAGFRFIWRNGCIPLPDDLNQLRLSQTAPDLQDSVQSHLCQLQAVCLESLVRLWRFEC